MRREPGSRRRVRGPVRATVLSALAVPAVLAVLAGCSDDEPAAGGSSTTAGERTTTTAAEEPAGQGTLRILVTNDDGVAAPGIDALVEALRGLPDTEVEVVAPAENQSGTGGKTTPGGAATAPATTASGFEATAVEGFPADTVVWALDEGGVEEAPDLVISGINSGQNLGPVIDLSGTVGAARAAAARGIPALAVSQGLADEPDFPAAVELVLDWIEEHRAELIDGADGEATVENLNVPTCATGEVKDVVEVPPDPAGQLSFEPTDCSVEVPPPAGDVAAFAAGYPTLSVLAVTPG